MHARARGGRKALPRRRRGGSRRRRREPRGEAGEMVALHGPSGSGKTTLLLLIAALLEPEQGTIRFDGRDLSSLSDDEASDYLLREVGFIYQSFHLMPRVSALENASIKLLLGGVGNARGAGARAALARARRAWATSAQHTRAALRRRAPARRDRARARGRAEADPRRRADRQPRQRPQPRDRRTALPRSRTSATPRVLLVTHDTEAAGARRSPLHAARRQAQRRPAQAAAQGPAHAAHWLVSHRGVSAPTRPGSSQASALMRPRASLPLPAPAARARRPGVLAGPRDRDRRGARVRGHRRQQQHRGLRSAKSSTRSSARQPAAARARGRTALTNACSRASSSLPGSSRPRRCSNRPRRSSARAAGASRRSRRRRHQPRGARRPRPHAPARGALGPGASAHQDDRATRSECSSRRSPAAAAPRRCSLELRGRATR